MRLPPLPALLLTLVAVALLAGCSQAPAATPPPQAPAPAEPEPTSQEWSVDFEWAAAAGVPNNDVRFLSTSPKTIEVEAGVARLAANATWTCASPTCDVFLYLCSPDEVAAAGPDLLGDPCAVQARGGSPLSLEAKDPAPGKWMVYVASDGPSAEVAGTVAVTAS